MLELEKYYFSLGYNDQCYGYPLLDHVWGYKKYFWQKTKYPKKYQQIYRNGQIQAYIDKKTEKPWFIK